MAKVKAIVSFAGADLSMYPGEEREIDDKLAASLSEAGHVEILSVKEKKPSTSEEAPKKEAKKNEGKRTKRTDS